MNDHLQQLQDLTPATVGKANLNNNNTPPQQSTTSSPLSTNNNCIKQCSACNQHITEKFLLHAMERYWHTACLKCSCCHAQLGDLGSTCFTKQGMILCKNDYLRLFGRTGTCASCGQSIPASELVMKVQGNVYHLNCFTCVTCHSRLVTGDRYSLVNGSLVCEHDYPKVMRGHLQVPLRPSHKVRSRTKQQQSANVSSCMDREPEFIQI